MRHGMIDGDRWIAERLAFLREMLGGDLSDEQREAVEAEVRVLSSERGIHQRGPRLFPWHPLRWISAGGRGRRSG